MSSSKVLPWTRWEFLFCFVVVWTVAIFQGYAIYQEWREETKLVEAFRLSGAGGIERRLQETKAVGSGNIKGLTLIGSVPGDMSMEEKGKRADRLFRSLDAAVVEAVRKEELYSIYGFSTEIKDSICYGEKEINLNLAFAYDELEDKTVMYLAVPFIQIDY